MPAERRAKRGVGAPGKRDRGPGAPRAIKVRALAKINLSLHIVGVRADGYHELRTIFQSIALHDTLTIRVRRGPFELQCDEPACPTDSTNLVWRAAERVWAASKRRGKLRDVAIHLAKGIPLQAGLGGGSSDAAATLRALGSMWRVDETRLRTIAGSLGADVPYFFEGGTVLGLERGDLLFPLLDHPAAWVVIVIPDFGVSTVDAYAWWDAGAGFITGAGPVAGQLHLVLAQERRSRLRAPRQAGRPVRRHPRGYETASNGPSLELRNDLQGPVVAHHPEIARIVAALTRAGAPYAAMSGSGSAVFGLFDRRPAADRAARALAAKGRRTLVSRTVNRSAYQRFAGRGGTAR